MQDQEHARIPASSAPEPPFLRRSVQETLSPSEGSGSLPPAATAEQPGARSSGKQAPEVQLDGREQKLLLGEGGESRRSEARLVPEAESEQ